MDFLKRSHILNVLHDTRDHHVFAVSERIHLYLNRTLQKMVD